MQFKVFPATLIEGQKVPLIKGWYEAATNDPNQIRLWQELFRDRIRFWGVPCGPVNGIFALDIDIKTNGWKTIQDLQLPIPNTLSQKTMNGGSHFIFRYPSDRHVGNKVGFLTGLDIRGERGWIAWHGIEVDFSKPILDAPPWIFDAMAKEKPSIAAAPANTNVRVVPEIAEAIIKSSLEAVRNAAEGESNNTLNIESYKLGQLVASQSVSREYAFEALFKAAKERGKPDYEAKATINSGLDGGAKHPLTTPFQTSAPVAHIPIPPPPEKPQRWTPTYFTEADLLNTQKLRKPQLFRDWSTEDISITTADGGTGKTTLKLYEAICLALGQPFLGFQCLQPGGKTLFITGEDTDKKLAAMLGAIMRQMGLFEEAVGNREKRQIILSSIIVKKDSDLCLIQKDRQGFLAPNKESLQKLLEAVEDIKPKMIVFDPISSFWGPESALNDMNRAVTKFIGELVERSHANVEMINHMGKTSSATKDMSQFAGRGGTGLPSNSRVSRVFRQIESDEYEKLTGENLTDSRSAILCNVNKFSDGSPLYNRPFVIVREGYLFTRKTLAPAKEKELEKQMSDLERVLTYVKEERRANRYPTRNVVIGFFKNCGDPISKERTTYALNLLQYTGYLGEKVILVPHPDVTISDKALVLADANGNEVQ